MSLWKTAYGSNEMIPVNKVKFLGEVDYMVGQIIHVQVQPTVLPRLSPRLEQGYNLYNYLYHIKQALKILILIHNIDIWQIGRRPNIEISLDDNQMVIIHFRW